MLFCQNTLIIYLFLKHNGIFCFVFRCMCMKYSVLITSGWRETLTKVNTQFLPISSVLCVKNEENLNELSLLLQNKLQFLPGFKQRSKVWLARLCLKCRGDLHDFIIDKNDPS